MASKKALLVINNGTLYRLEACEAERKRWQLLFGANTGHDVTPEFVATCIRRDFSIPWFLKKTCGPKTMIQIAGDIEPSVRADLAPLLDIGWRNLMGAAVAQGTVLDVSNLEYLRLNDERYYQKRALMAWAAGRHTALRVSRADRGMPMLMRLVDAIGWMAYAVPPDNDGGTPLKGIEASCTALAESVIRRSRVINRALSLANTRRNAAG